MTRIILIIFLIVSNTFLILGSKINSEKIIIECSIHPVGLNYDLYIITVSSGGDYILKIKSDEKTCTTYSIQLDSNKMNQLVSIINKTKSIKGFSDIVIAKGGWEYQITIDNNVYHYDNYGHDLFDKIITMLFQFSPIPIELRGFS